MTPWRRISKHPRGRGGEAGGLSLVFGLPPAYFARHTDWGLIVATVVNLEASRLEANKRAKSKALDALVDLVEDDLKAVNRTIVARIDGHRRMLSIL